MQSTYTNIKDNPHNAGRYDWGAMTDVLSQFLQGIAQKNIHPLVFHMDKDNSELIAISEVWICSVLPEYVIFN